MTLEAAIRDKLNLNHVTFAELSRIEGFNGDQVICSRKYPSVIFWPGVSNEAYEILTRLYDEGVYHYDARGNSTWMCYLIDGLAVRLPLAKRATQYKKPHWLPVTLTLGPERSRARKR